MGHARMCWSASSRGRDHFTKHRRPYLILTNNPTPCFPQMHPGRACPDNVDVITIVIITLALLSPPSTGLCPHFLLLEGRASEAVRVEGRAGEVKGDDDNGDDIHIVRTSPAWMHLWKTWSWVVGEDEVGPSMLREVVSPPLMRLTNTFLHAP